MSTMETLAAVLQEFVGEQGEGKARKLLEEIRWPDGPVCPHCGAKDPYILKPRPTSRRPGRPGLYKCRARGCRKQFTVRVRSIMQDSHIPYRTWVIAFQMLASSKGISAQWLHRELELDYKSAWFMAHRIRRAVKRPPLAGTLAVIVDVDET
jgi:transposase-like protein